MSLSFRRLLFVISYFGLPTALAAQQSVLTAGRVVRIRGKDTVGVASTRVVLHRVGHTAQGPIDSTTTGSHGEFQFRFRADTTAVYLLSSGFAGIEYFSTPVHTNPVKPDTGLMLIVSDTSSVAPIAVASRHIVISRPAKDGTRPTLEIVVLNNNGNTTRVSRDSTHPTWSARLPRGVVNFQVGQGDVSTEAVEVRDDSILLFAPVAPGEKQLLYTYQLPASPGAVRIPVAESVASMNLLLEEFDRHVTGAGITKADSQRIESRSFQQWNGPVGPGAVIGIDFPGNRTQWFLPTLVSALGVALVTVLARALRQRPAPGGAPGPGSLLDELARLDARFAGREAEVTPAEWSAYQVERAHLKREVTSQLAGRKLRP